MLHDHRARGDPVSLRHIKYLKFDEVAGAALRVDREMAAETLRDGVSAARWLIHGKA